MDMMFRISFCFGVVIWGGGWLLYVCNVFIVDGDVFCMFVIFFFVDFYLFFKRDKWWCRVEVFRV